MLKRFAAALLALLFLTGAADRPIEPAKPDDLDQMKRRVLLAGTFFGEAVTTTGAKRQQLTKRGLDGRFKVTFHFIEPSGEQWQQTEVGFWGVSANVYFTMTLGWLEGGEFKPADTTSAYFNDAYEILELTSERFRYRALQWSDEFVVVRVPETFIFPKLDP